MKSIKKVYFVLLLFVSTLIVNCGIAYASPSYTAKVTADGAILIDATSGDILYEKNSNVSFPPASTTKIMTALLTLENCKDLKEKVKITKEAESIDGSKIYIFKDEEITVEDLLYALLLSSANDCAYALAVHIGGTYENFISMMNKRASQLGCKNTNFINPHGLYNENHKSSAADLSLIMKELIKHQKYIEISSTPSYNMNITNKCNKTRPLWNGNKAIHKFDSKHYKYTKASKTGYTTQSQHSYVSYAEKDGQKFIVALTHDKDKNFYNDSKTLFDFAFDNYHTTKLFNKGQVIKETSLNNTPMKLLAKGDLYITRSKNASGDPIIKDISFDTKNIASKVIKKNDFICTGTVTVDGRNVDFEIVSDRDYTPPKQLQVPSKSSHSILSSILKYVFILLKYVLLAFIVFIIARGLVKKYKRAKLRQLAVQNRRNNYMSRKKDE
ncbi:D-alanyl-D-alanine carboxypeptidase [Hathewaya proteolytica DSM 3090]|uniref:serine-type D-Ala-D-Ala carboxypeptidase n=1 Tax=Hathewaya proteolytica DSM 3090 TaxID=1121331 RepID=A0A1M6JIL5_9CLOT|nr:D-alanyl-D-alanine carboxypeptidase family protein [Hathewaya proteolytica]SHJ46539.1 D-alanyl-D-alanine carboxypeptidase [Hathewaya proteolytica DSM 3090]